MKTEAEKKAKELVDKLLLATHNKQIYTDEMAKQCALIACEELIASYSQYKERYEQDIFDNEVAFWQEVKTAIQAL